MWSIALLENTVMITSECAEELFENAQEYQEDIWWESDDVIYGGKLRFNPDHQEHMDFLWRKEIQELLKKYRVEGRICFADVEGDSSGSFWGYQFDGQGNLENLKGKVVWSVEDAA